MEMLDNKRSGSDERLFITMFEAGSELVLEVLASKIPYLVALN